MLLYVFKLKIHNLFSFANNQWRSQIGDETFYQLKECEKNDKK